MDDLAVWCGFLGAWLLVAGPIYQASLELQAEEEASDRVRRLQDETPLPPPPSGWWWLLPPMRFYLGHQRREEHKRTMLDSMSDDDFELISRYMNKAAGWAFVGAGGFLIAAKETWELVHHLEGGVLAFAVAVVAMALLCLANVAARSRASSREMSTHRARERRSGRPERGSEERDE